MESNSLRQRHLPHLQAASLRVPNAKQIETIGSRNLRHTGITLLQFQFLAYAGCQRLSVSVSLYFDPREKPLERSAVPLMEGGLVEAQVFSEIIGCRWFQVVFRWLQVVAGSFRCLQVVLGGFRLQFIPPFGAYGNTSKPKLDDQRG